MHRRMIMKPISRETIVDRRQPQMRWSSVFAGAVMSFGIWILLETLGTGLGLIAIDTDDSGSLRGVGIGTGVWALIAPIIAMFVGGIVAGRLSGSHDTRIGALHGGVQWALSAAVGTYLMVSMIMGLASGVTRAGATAVSAGSSAVSHAAPGVTNALGLDVDDLIGPVNAKLRAQGKPEVTVRQVERAVRATARRGLHDGRLDRDVLAQELANDTALTRADVDDLARQIQDRAPERLDELGERAKTAALETADAAGKGLLMSGIAMLLGLAAAAGGGALGARLTSRRYRGDGGADPRDGILTPPPPTMAGPAGTVTPVAGTQAPTFDPYAR